MRLAERGMACSETTFTGVCIRTGRLRRCKLLSRAQRRNANGAHKKTDFLLLEIARAPRFVCVRRDLFTKSLPLWLPLVARARRILLDVVEVKSILMKPLCSKGGSWMGMNVVGFVLSEMKRVPARDLSLLTLADYQSKFHPLRVLLHWPRNSSNCVCFSRVNAEVSIRCTFNNKNPTSRT